MEIESGETIYAIGALARQEIPSRGCGDLDPPSVYLVGPDDITFQKGFRKSRLGLEGDRINVFEKPIWSWMKHFKGFMFVDDIEDYRK